MTSDPINTFSPMKLYDSEQEASLLKDIPDMMLESQSLRDLCVAPTFQQRIRIATCVWSHIKKMRRKVYGGHALSAALSLISSDAPYEVYKDPSSWTTATFPDIDFYSPNPIQDIIDICDVLRSQGMNYVQGKEAANNGSFAISVEFVKVCNVTFVPANVYNHIPNTLFGDLHMVDPGFAMIDHLKIICDPFTSYWKLERMLPRMLLINKHFPLMLPNSKERTNKVIKVAEELNTDIVAWASSMLSIAAVGDYALDYFEKHTGHRSDHLTLISTEYECDVGIFNEIYKVSDVKLYKVRERKQLMDDLGRSATFYFYGKTGRLEFAVTFIDARHKAVPVCGISEAGLKIASFSYCVMTSLCLQMSAIVNKCVAEAEFHMQTTSRLLKSKDSVESNEMFRDVRLDFIGSPKTAMQVHMAATDKRKTISHGNAPVWFTYDPSKPSSRGYMMKYVLLAHDGMMITNKKDSVFS